MYDMCVYKKWNKNINFGQYCWRGMYHLLHTSSSGWQCVSAGEIFSLTPMGMRTTVSVINFHNYARIKHLLQRNLFEVGAKKIGNVFLIWARDCE